MSIHDNIFWVILENEGEEERKGSSSRSLISLTNTVTNTVTNSEISRLGSGGMSTG